MKKLFAIVLSLSIIVNLVSPVVLAYEVPSAPDAPTAPAAPTSAPTAPDAPDAPQNPTETTPEPTRAPRATNTPEPTQTQAPNPTPTSQPTTATTAGVTPTPTTTQGGNVGDTRIVTGDATNDSTIITTGNDNLSQTPSGNDDSASISTDGNGSNSSNETNLSNSSNNTTTQNNSAAVNTDLDQSATTGDNNSSGNVGDTYIKTGDANVSGTVITSVNTNVDGIMVSEFNVDDDHMGDIVLDFGNNCISGCGTGGTEVNTSGNGSNSTNTTNVANSSNDATFQNNEATIGNELTLNANSGNNTASQNTGGESIIYTGDANVSANALTFANNNIEGNVVYGVVNIYGDLVGDIIFPEEQMGTACCGNNNMNVATTDNGANSTNQTNVSNSQNDVTFQTNDAVIDNELVLDAQTGDNTISGNTNGDNRAYTGSANVDANVINVANNNIDGGNMWLVIVNEAGKWIGKILGGDSSNMAASEGTTITTDANGQVVATNGNGANSTNETNVSNSSNNTTEQNNDANIQNTLNLSANTGGNEASYNTGGNSSVITGDANIIANMVNFVNNNITGNGKLFVTVVNVFGSWLGDFVTPGQQQQTHTTQELASAPNIGGSNVRTVSTTPTPVVQSNSAAGTTEVINETTLTTSPTRTYKGVTRKVSVLGSDTEEQIVIDEEAQLDIPESTITPVVAGQRVVKVNLAWLIFIIPSGILLFILRGLTRRVFKRLP